MQATEHHQLFDRVRAHAFRQLSQSKLHTTNLYLDERVYPEGEVIGPKRQNIVASRPTILVFADDDPHANFSHQCRYLLYDAKSGQLHREAPAQFPPFVKARSQTLKAFHEPLRFTEPPIFYRARPIFWPPILIPEGDRYAVLFSGMSNKRHLNDLEFLYRTLIDRYAFDPDHIYVLHFDSTLNTQDGVQTNWPGDGTAYRIQITGEGTRSAFESAIDDLKKRLGEDDLLFIHTNNHGGYDGTPGTGNLCTYPQWDAYYASDFSSKLGELPKFEKLMVMMEQCHAGGFNAPITAKSTAAATSIASAATEPNNSYVSADGNWDPFARDWIAAQAGQDPFGAALVFNPDSDQNGQIEAEEAFYYADVVKDPRDTPNFLENSEAGGDIALGQEYEIWAWWDEILREALETYYMKLPPHEYYAKVRKIQPELSKLAVSLDKRSAELRKEVTSKVENVVVPVFGKAAEVAKIA